jgi:hypothetical protein
VIDDSVSFGTSDGTPVDQSADQPADKGNTNG